MAFGSLVPFGSNGLVTLVESAPGQTPRRARPDDSESFILISSLRGPKIGVHFIKHLKHNPFNLIYSCRCCNGLKSNWWPAPGTKDTFVGTEGFIDPFWVDRRQFFEVAVEGVILAKQHPAAYMITLLALDRPFLRRLRERRILKAELVGLVENLKRQAEGVLADNPGVNPKEVCKLVLDVTSRLERFLK